MSLLIVLGAIAALVIITVRRSYKLHHIRMHRPVYVRGATDRYPDLPLGDYGVPIRTGDATRPNRVEMIFPRLTPDGDVEYIYSWHDLSDVDIAQATTKSWLSRTFANNLAPTILEHLRLEADLADLYVKQTKLDQLIELVSTSEFYASQVTTYEQAHAQLSTLTQKAEALQNLHIRLIREALIGSHISSLDASTLLDGSPDFEQNYQQLKEEFLFLKESAIAYTELLQGVKL